MSTELDTTGLDAWLAGLDGTTDQIAEDIARDVEAREQLYVPVQTGALRTSIEVFGAKGSNQRTVSAGQSLDYAEDVEFGTEARAATPFATPAAEHADIEAIGKARLQELERSARR